MDRRFTLFAILVALVFVANQVIYSLLFPPQPAAKDAAKPAVAKAEPGKAASGKGALAKAGKAAELKAAPAPPAEAAAEGPAKPASNDKPDKGHDAPISGEKEQWGTLGSADPDSPYRVLVTWTNSGAAIERIELNSARYHDLEDRSGYLGHLEPADAPRRAGAVVHVVGPGTPAERAGIKPLDVITAVGSRRVTSAESLVEALKTTRPKEAVSISIDRQGAAQKLTAQLAWHPLQVIRPELDSKPLEVVPPENRSGYLGHFDPADAPLEAGALVRVVGPGTPAERAGIKPLDVITAVGSKKVTSAESLVAALKTTRPNEVVSISIDRQGAAQELTAQLAVPPVDHDPFSFLLTIQQFDDRTLAGNNGELDGVKLYSSEWEVLRATQDIVIFRKKLPTPLGLRVTKTFRLVKVPPDRLADPDYPAYSLQLDVSIANEDDQPHSVAYRLGGPTGLPIEGAWYATKVSRNWGGAGMRDIVVHFNGGTTEQIACATIADPQFKRSFSNSPLDFIAVDGIYFASAVIPQKESPSAVLFAEVKPVCVGLPADKANWRLADVSFQLDSAIAELKPGGEPLEHHLQIFAGPKRPTLLAEYPAQTVTLKDLTYYGWPIFAFVARPMQAILHVFYHWVGNYGLAIIMLTVLVRGCMFPVSRRQALNAQKMQELQPEVKRIQEKYKNDAAKKAKEQQELFRQHNYNPLSGCLPALVQLPIFLGLYRSLMVDVELRQAPLFGDSIRWASNLAAPDMFWDWTPVVPDFVSHGTGILGLGPYLNILPLVTIGLFIWQQKMFMPPPADEQAALQQKMMQYMSIFVGVMFFKVASGLCVYLIASSIWGICERKLLPRARAASPASASKGTGAVAAGAPASGNGAAVAKKRQRGRR